MCNTNCKTCQHDDNEDTYFQPDGFEVIDEIGLDEVEEEEIAKEGYMINNHYKVITRGDANTPFKAIRVDPLDTIINNFEKE